MNISLDYKYHTKKAFSTIEIKWRAKGNKSSFVNIHYSDDGGIFWQDIIFTKNDGSYIWDVPNINSTECLLKIEDFSDNSIFGISKSNFTIVLQ